MRNYRLHWDAKVGWIIDTDVALSTFQLNHICKWAVPKQIDRWKSLPIGAKKDELESAIKLLQKGCIQQRLIESDDGAACLFKSDKSTGKIISIGGI